jgi:carboxypeptidase C (cathepsin A)
MIGFLTEQGPFKPLENGKLSFNENAWNTIANMVFIESPTGVGFSYGSDPNDYYADDTQTALDNYHLIQAFLNRFPHFKDHSLYITSESYGGHYMPTLAKRIVDENTAGANPHLNFKGFAVGNPYTTVYSGESAMFDTFWGHQLVSKQSYEEFLRLCYSNQTENQDECYNSADKLFEEVGDFNPYALDFPVCSTPVKYGRRQRQWFRRSLHAQRSDTQKATTRELSSDAYEPCTSNYAVTYLNRDEVKDAIHVTSNIAWEECSRVMHYNYSDSDISMTPIYNYLIDGNYGLDILVYSGDDDSICATIGTQDWIWDLGYNISGTPWSTYTVGGQTAGFLTKWTNTKLAFLTVHGAGHEVPAYRPDVALDLWTKYLKGEFTN